MAVGYMYIDAIGAGGLWRTTTIATGRTSISGLVAFSGVFGVSRG